jgi:hypothetical protein
MTNTIKAALGRWYHRTRLKLGAGLHKFVLDGEEDAARMRRRFHIHVCLLGGSGLLTYFGVLGDVSSTTVTVLSPCLLVLQEGIDRVGRF